MNVSPSRLTALVALSLIIFAVASFILLQIMPRPLRPVDYLIVGGVGTLLTLLTIWLLLMREIGGERDMLYKKRRRAAEIDPAGAPGGEGEGGA